MGHIAASVEGIGTDMCYAFFDGDAVQMFPAKVWKFVLIIIAVVAVVGKIRYFFGSTRSQDQRFHIG